MSRKKWTPEEDNKVLKAMDLGLASHLIKVPGRTKFAVKQRITMLRTKKKKKKRTGKRWTPEEDIKLAQLKNDGVAWEDMDLPGRTVPALTNRWHDYLKDQPRRVPFPSSPPVPNRPGANHRWTREEDVELVTRVQAGETISHLTIGGRSISATKNRWDTIQDRQDEILSREEDSPADTRKKSSKKSQDSNQEVDLDAELQNLCKEYTYETLPSDLGDYCFLLESAANHGWNIVSVDKSKATLRSPPESPNESKSLVIEGKTHDFEMTTCSKISIWRRVVLNMSNRESNMGIKTRSLQWLLEKPVFDTDGNLLPPISQDKV